MMKTIRVTILVAGLAVLVVLALVQFWPQMPRDSTLTSPDTPPARLVCSGYVDSRQGQVLLQPARVGRVTQVFVQDKQHVSKDTPLVQLDDQVVKLQEQEAALAVESAKLQLARARDGLRQYQAKRAQAEAGVRAAHAKAVGAQYYLTIEELLHKQGFSNKDRVEAVRAQLDGAKALADVEQNRLAELTAVDPELEVKLAQLQSDRSQAQLERARREREEHLLRSPVSGLVLRVQVQEGDLIGPTSPRPVIWLATEGAWVVRAEVSQEFAGQVCEGQAVRVEDEVSGTLLAKGKVAEVSDWFLPRRQVNAPPTGVNTGLTLECVIDLDEGHAHLRLGQRVRVRILADQAAGSMGVSN